MNESWTDLEVYGVGCAQCDILVGQWRGVEGFIYA